MTAILKPKKDLYNFCSQYKNLFRRDQFAFENAETSLHNFSSRCQACQSLDFLWVFTGPFYCFLTNFRAFLENLGSLSLLFHFRRTVMFLTRKNLAYQICIKYYNKAHCSIVMIHKLFQIQFSKYYPKLRKATGALQETYLRKKCHSFRPRNLRSISLFGQIWSSVELHW